MDRSDAGFATAGLAHRSTTKPYPLWLWPTLLSLDATAVAITWLLLFARSFRVPLGGAPIAALGLWVWLLYAGDRILDGLREPSPAVETRRHRFYRMNRRPALIVAGIVAATALVISLVWLDAATRRAGFELALLVAGYFAVTHLAFPANRAFWPKELFVAVLFAAGVCLPVWSELGADRTRLIGPLLMLTAVFWINALGIDCWENAPDRAARRQIESRTSRALAVRLGPAAMGLAIFSAILGFDSSAAPIYLSIAISALLLMILELNSSRLITPILRVTADTALLTPLLFLLRHF